MRSSKFSTAFNISTAFFALAVQMLVSFFLSSFLVSNLGEVTNGLTQLANNFVSYASLITLAFNSMGARFISTAYHKGEFEKAKGYYSTLVISNIFLCLIILIPAVYIVKNLSSIIALGDANAHDASILFAFVFANYGANLFISLFCSAMFVTNTIYWQNAINLGKNILNAMLLFIVFRYFEPHVQYVSIITFSLTMVAIPICYYLKNRLLPKISFDLKDFSFSYVKNLISSGIWNTVNQCGNLLNTGLDLLLANWFVGPVPMGILSVAKTVPSAIISLVSTINSNLEPELVIAYAKDGKSGIKNKLFFDMKLSNFIISVPIAAFCALSIPFYKLWMPTLDSTQLAILSFLSIMAYIPWASLQVLYNVFTATNHLKVNSLAFLGGSILNAIVVIILLKTTDLGIYAVAGTSSVLTIIRSFVITAPYVSSLIDIRLRTLYKYSLLSIISAILCVVICKGMSLIINTENWLTLITTLLISCLISWIVVLFITFNKDERSIVFKIVKKIFHK